MDATRHRGCIGGWQRELFQPITVADPAATSGAMPMSFAMLIGRKRVMPKSARGSPQENTELGAKAGVMMRETLDTGSRYAMVSVTPDGLLFQSRASPNGASAYQQIFDLSAPYWVKLVRAGNRFTGYVSADGVSWTAFTTPVTISMASAAFGGLAVTSHNDGILSTVYFDQVAGVSGVSAPPISPLPVPWQSGMSARSCWPVGPAILVVSLRSADRAKAFGAPLTRSIVFIDRGQATSKSSLALLRFRIPRSGRRRGSWFAKRLILISPGVLLAFTPREGAGMQSRSEVGGASTFVRGPGLTAPAWLKLVRRGNEFAGSVSSDGNAWWAPLGNLTVPMSQPFSSAWRRALWTVSA